MDELEVFISYRRADTQHLAGRLGDRVSQQFPLFMDIDDIPLGADFSAALDRAIAASDVLLVLIGPRFLDGRIAGDAIDWSRDWVRAEVSAGLARNLVVIPVLVDNAEMPEEHQLPAEMWPLRRRQALRIGHASFNADVDRLLETLVGLDRARRAPEPTNEARPVSRPVTVAAPDAAEAAPWASRLSPPDPVQPGRPADQVAPVLTIGAVDDRQLTGLVAGGAVLVLALIEITAHALLYYRYPGFQPILVGVLAALVVACTAGLATRARRMEADSRPRLYAWSASAAVTGVVLTVLGYALLRHPFFKGAYYYLVGGDHSDSLPVYLPMIMLTGVLISVAWYVVGRRRLGVAVIWPAALSLSAGLLTAIALIVTFDPTQG